MSSREEQWKLIKQEYHAHSMPEGKVEKMKENIRKTQKGKRKIARAIISGAAAAAIIITILPNASQSAAYAMSRIPILSKWVEVVTFRNYQYETDRHTADIQAPEIKINPKTDSPAKDTLQKTAEDINAEIESISNRLIAEFEENAKDQEGYQNMKVSSEVIAATEDYFTLKLICYQGAGSGAEWDYFYTIDLKTGKRLALKDLFQENSDYITVISENIKQQMKAQMAEDDSLFYWVDYADVPEWNFEKITDETQFYLNDKGDVVVCFNEGDVAPMYMGCVEFTIPGDILSSIRAN